MIVIISNIIFNIDIEFKFKFRCIKLINFDIPYIICLYPLIYI